MATDPDRLRASYAEARGLNSFTLLLGDLKTLSIACMMSRGRIRSGNGLSLALAF